MMGEYVIFVILLGVMILLGVIFAFLLIESVVAMWARDK